MRPWKLALLILWEFAGVVTMVLGFGGTADDVQQWRQWIQSFDFSNPNWLVVGLGIGMTLAPVFGSFFFQTGGEVVEGKQKEAQENLPAYESMPTGFITLRAALRLVIDRRAKGKMSGAMAVAAACDEMRRRALEDRTRIWGRRKGSATFEATTAEYWKTSKIDEMDQMAEDGTGGQTHQHYFIDGYRFYLDLCVSPTELGEFWPEERKGPF